MFRRTSLSVFITVTPRMADMVTVITGLGRIITAGAAGAAGATAAGEVVAGIEVGLECSAIWRNVDF